ncbi:Endosomal targeting BRO1-like domain-containing protein [Perilla frutescens var. hirtella]|uniref:Endosomal targeting BRO1-like domain-containing protein n=1 Tax=Perilla frutescens var. hirtella TaxID=608512 RepID=A0AAD4IY96_PERFH|nr:Endosomal targeting BRO1-like domain-containing protein [Perilla frutescens var. frutescens]KAH6823745.1 Endosomal targeting BRO1-like domain-containing protein [Perilla frutescens var. hirtella]
MGCTSSVYAIGKKKKKIIPEISVFFPVLRIPMQSDLQIILRGLLPKDLADRIASVRNHIVLVAEDTGGAAINELTRALEEYLPLLLGITKKEYGLQESLEFRWRELRDGRQEICMANSWFELLSVLHMMAMLTLMEANEKLIPKESSLSERLVSADCMRDAVDLLLKAAGYLSFCAHDVLLRLPTEIKNKLPSDMQGQVLEAISHQALAQGTELQLGLAVQSQNATLSVKRRLGCELLSYYAQAYGCLSNMKENSTALKKQLFFLKWKHLEAKAAAYYYHGLILDKGTEPSSHVSAVCCFLGAEELLAESKKACLTFCLAHPITRCPPPWGAMKHLHKKIPETASKKSQMYGYLLDQEKDLRILADLPEFQLSLKPDDYDLPELDPAWDFPPQTLKEHLNEAYNA